MNLKFTKMQATGNDYIFANLFDANDFKIFNETNWSQMAIRLSDRHFGRGSDGLIHQMSLIVVCACLMLMALREPCAEMEYAAWGNMYMNAD